MKDSILKMKHTISDFFKKTKKEIQETILKIDNKTNPKIGYYAWKISKLTSILLFLIVIPLLPIIITAFGFDINGEFSAELVRWGLSLTIVVFCLLFVSLFLWYWFSKFRDYK